MWKGKRAERRRDGRMPAPDLDVSYSTEKAQRRVRVKNISATGVYLLTDDQLTPGTDMALTLEKTGVAVEEGLPAPLEDEPRPKVQLLAKAVRVGDDGVALAFEQGAGNGTSFASLMQEAAKLTGETDPVRLFRITKALAFVLHISPAAQGDMNQIISNRMSLERAGRAIEITLKAEEMAAAHQGAIRTDVPAELVVLILEDGSKVDEVQTRRMWSELLAASSCAGSKDSENISYAILLSRLDAVQMRIFDAACKLAMQVGWEPGFEYHQDLHCSAEEIRKVTHIQNLMGIERDLNHLFELGLLGQTDRPVLCQQVETVNMTPTALALKLYARCHGQPEPPVTFAGAKLPKAS